MILIIGKYALFVEEITIQILTPLEIGVMLVIANTNARVPVVLKTPSPMIFPFKTKMTTVIGRSVKTVVPVQMKQHILMTSMVRIPQTIGGCVPVEPFSLAQQNRIVTQMAMDFVYVEQPFILMCSLKPGAVMLLATGISAAVEKNSHNRLLRIPM